MNRYVFASLILTLACSLVTANLISDGDFNLATLNAGSDELIFSSDSLCKWYTYSTSKENFYQITEQGYVSPSAKDQSGRTLIQLIEAPRAGDYNFSFDYRLSDDSDMFSVVRVFGVDDDDADFSVSLDSWIPSFTGVFGSSVLYDQGGYASSLAGVDDWTGVSSLLTVGRDIDYLAICTAFSYDGTIDSMLTDYADIDNFVLSSVPEPATMALLAAGVLLVVNRKK